MVIYALDLALEEFDVWNEVPHSQNSLVVHSDIIGGSTQIRYVGPNYFKAQLFESWLALNCS